MNKAKPGALWDDAVVEEGLAWRHPSAIPCDRLAGWERYRETAGTGTGRGTGTGSLRTRSQSAPAFFLGTINLFPEDFVHAPEFAVRNTETTVGMGSVAI